MSAFIQLKDLSFCYSNFDDSSQKVLNNINLQIQKGDFIAIIGHNGSGKSTLSRCFNGLYLPSNGSVLVDGMNTKDQDLIYKIRSKVGLIFQNPDNQIVSGVVEEDVAFGPENLGLDPLEIRKRVDDSLKAVDMFSYKESASYKLSGGQKQRIAIAGILAMQPDCIVLDEPTSMLDPKGKREVIDIIKYLNKNKGITIILITHFMDEATVANKVIVMSKGQILKQDTPQKIFSDIDFIRKQNLEIPQSTQIIFKLKQLGYNLPNGVLNTAECVAVLEQLLEARYV